MDGYERKRYTGSHVGHNQGVNKDGSTIGCDRQTLMSLYINVTKMEV